MGVLTKALTLIGLQRKQEFSPTEWTDGRHTGSIGDAGEAVNGVSALGLDAVWACANLISGSISSLPFQVYRDQNGVRIADRQHPLYRVLHDSPNYDQTALDFWDFACLSLELWGNAYARVIRRNDQIIALRPVRPDLMVVRRLKSGSLQYVWTQDGERFELLDRDVLHIRGPGGDPLGGMSTLTFAREAFSSALAAERTAARMFRNGLRATGAFKWKEWLTPEQRQQAEKVVDSYVGSMNAGRPLKLEGGMEYQTLSITPEDAQMLETRGFSVEQICRFFGVPPVMVGHAAGSTAWPTSVEAQVLTFQKFTLRRRLKRIEQAVSQQLLTPQDRAAGVSVEFNMEGLLRGDSAARSSFYQTMTGMGAMTINEVRKLENLPPVEGGDEARMQMQNVPITQSGQEVV